MPDPDRLRPGVAIVGAGMAGMSCARRLTDAGFAVSVFEKSRGLGGRMATRRQEPQTLDHGAQYFRARDPRFLAQVEAWLEAGTVATWRPRLANFGPQGRVFVADTHPRYVGAPTMNAPVKAMAADLDVRREQRVTALSRQSGGWQLETEQGSAAGPFEHVVLAVPAPQALVLATGVSTLTEDLPQVSMAPCWAVMAVFRRRLDVDFDAVRFERGAVAWACRDSTKAGRPDGETWILHADADWSRGHLEQAPGAIKRVLLDAFFSQVERPTRWPTALDCHLWRYARTKSGVEDGYLLDAETGLAACGDWALGVSNVENAWLSGLSLAERLIGERTP